MKTCPVCRSQYTDPTLQFCLQDGAVLAAEIRQSSIETVAFSSPVTVEKIAPTVEMNLPAAPSVARSETPNFQNPPPAAPRDAGKNSRSRLIWLTILPILLVVGAAGAGGWFYLKNQSEPSAQKTSENQVSPAGPQKNASSESAVTSPKVAEEKSAPVDSANPTPVSDHEAAKREIAETIDAWKAAAQNRNPADFSARYAETVDYHDKPATFADIRTEAQKTFAAYSEIEITLSNVRIAVDSDRKNATAVFDKEWSYETGKDLTEGKAHAKLQLQKIGGDWKIVGEKHLKTYYLEN